MMAATCFKYVINIPRIIMGMQLMGIWIGKVIQNFRLEIRYNAIIEIDSRFILITMEIIGVVDLLNKVYVRFVPNKCNWR